MNLNALALSIVSTFSLCSFHQAMSMSLQSNMVVVQIVQEHKIANALEECIWRFEESCRENIVPLKEQILASPQAFAPIIPDLIEAMHNTYRHSIMSMKFPNSFEPYLLATIIETVRTELAVRLSPGQFSTQECIELIEQFINNLPTQLKNILECYTNNQRNDVNLQELLISTLQTIGTSMKLAPDLLTVLSFETGQSTADLLIEIRKHIVIMPPLLNWALQRTVALISQDHEMQQYFFDGLEQAKQEFNTELYGSLEELRAGINKLDQTRLEIAHNWLEIVNTINS